MLHNLNKMDMKGRYAWLTGPKIVVVQIIFQKLTRNVKAQILIKGEKISTQREE